MEIAAAQNYTVKTWGRRWGKGTHLWSNRCMENGGVTKIFISYTFIQKDKFPVTLNSQLQNGIVWPNHKAVW